MDIESTCIETKVLIVTLTEKILKTALTKPSLNIQTNRTNVQFLAGLARQVSVAKN